jgi:hypothetical protein
VVRDIAIGFIVTLQLTYLCRAQSAASQATFSKSHSRPRQLQTSLHRPAVNQLPQTSHNQHRTAVSWILHHLDSVTGSDFVEVGGLKLSNLSNGTDKLGLDVTGGFCPVHWTASSETLAYVSYVYPTTPMSFQLASLNIFKEFCIECKKVTADVCLGTMFISTRVSFTGSQLTPSSHLLVYS